MNLSPVSFAAEGAWCDGRGLRICCLQMEEELLKVSDHDSNAGLWVCLWSFFLITWPSTTSFDALQKPNLTNMRWVPTKCQTPHWVVLAGISIPIFPFLDEENEVRRREGSCPRSHSWITDESVQESKSVLPFPRLRVSLSQSIYRYLMLEWMNERKGWMNFGNWDREESLYSGWHWMSPLPGPTSFFSFIPAYPTSRTVSSHSCAFSKQALSPLYIFAQDIPPSWQALLSTFPVKIPSTL